MGRACRGAIGQEGALLLGVIGEKFRFILFGVILRAAVAAAVRRRHLYRDDLRAATRRSLQAGSAIAARTRSCCCGPAGSRVVWSA